MDRMILEGTWESKLPVHDALKDLAVFEQLVGARFVSVAAPLDQARSVQPRDALSAGQIGLV